MDRFILLIILLSPVFISCTRSVDSSRLTLHLPAKIESSSERSSSEKSSSVGTLNLWSLAAPTSFDEVDCYAVAYFVPGTANLTCTAVSSDTEVVTDILGLYAPGSRISLELASGKKRRFHVIGFRSTLGSCRNSPWTNFDRKNLSRPLVLGSTLVDLEPGDNQVSLVARFEGASEWVDCQKRVGDIKVLPTVQLSSAISSISEGGTFTVEAKLSEVYGTSIRVPILLTPIGWGGAITPTSSQIEIPAGATTGVVNINIAENNISEPGTPQLVVMPGPTPEVILSGSEVRVNLIDNDPLPTVQFATTSSTVGEAANSQINITINTSHPSAASVVINLSSTSTATLGSDYSFIGAQTLILQPGVTSVVITVRALDDALVEPDETLTLSISNPTNATIGSVSQHVVVIQSEDSIGSFSVLGVTGANDTMMDNFLSRSTSPTFTWTAASGATSYDVKIRNATNTSEVCTSVTTTSLSLQVVCAALTVGSTYTAVITPLAGSISGTAQFFSFTLNQNPTVVNEIIYALNTTTGPYSVLSNDSDPEGQAIEIVSATAPDGTLTTSPTQIQYTPPMGFIGEKQITYVVKDTKGGESSGLLKLRLGTPSTWRGGVSSDWFNSGNWFGGAVPGNSMRVVISNEVKETFLPSLSASTSINGLHILSGSVVITGGTLSVGNDYLKIFDGELNAASASAVTIASSLDLLSSTSTYKAPPITNAAGFNFVSGATFVHNSGDLVINSTSVYPFTASGQVFYDLEVGGSSLQSANGSFGVAGEFRYVKSGGEFFGNAAITFTGPQASFTCGNNVNINCCSSFATRPILKFEGTGNQVLLANSDCRLVNILINKTGGTVLFGSVSYWINKNFTYTQGAIDAATADFHFLSGDPATYTFSTPMSIGDAYFENASNQTLSGTLRVADLFWDRTAQTNGGRIEVLGNVNVTSGFGGSTLVALTGSGNQTVTGNANTALPSFSIEKPSGMVLWSNTPGFGGSFTYVSGSVQSTGPALRFAPSNTTNHILNFGPISYPPITFVGGGSGRNWTLASPLVSTGAIGFSNVPATLSLGGQALTGTSISLPVGATIQLQGGTLSPTPTGGGSVIP